MCARDSNITLAVCESCNLLRVAGLQPCLTLPTGYTQPGDVLSVWISMNLPMLQGFMPVLPFPENSTCPDGFVVCLQHVQHVCLIGLHGGAALPRVHPP